MGFPTNQYLGFPNSAAGILPVVEDSFNITINMPNPTGFPLIMALTHAKVNGFVFQSLYNLVLRPDSDPL